MKTTFALSFTLLAFTWLPPSCQNKPAPIKSAVVAPVGPATAAVAPAVDDSTKADAAVKSKISAAAEVILDLNQTQPASPASAGITGEATGIKQLAGEPTDADRADALKRKAVDLAGDVATITAQYAKEHDDNVSLRTRAELAEKAVTDTLSASKLEQEKQRGIYQAELDRVTNEANERVSSAAAKAKRDADAKLNFWLQLGTFGGGILFLVLAAAASQFAVAAPFIGPNIVRLLAAAGVTLIVIGLLIRAVDRFIDQHPYLFWAGLIGVVLAITGALLLAWSNHHHHTEIPAHP